MLQFVRIKVSLRFIDVFHESKIGAEHKIFVGSISICKKRLEEAGDFNAHFKHDQIISFFK